MGTLVLAILMASFRSLAGEALVKWEKEIETTEEAPGIKRGKMVNFFTLRVPMCSFLGGILFGASEPKNLWIFYDKPFRYYTNGFDFVLEGEGKVFGIRAVIWRYKEQGNLQKFRSFFCRLRGMTLGKNHPSYVLVNGRRVWDAKKHARGTAGIQAALQFPFWAEEAEDLVIDFVVDRNYTPEVKAFAFRYGSDQLRYLGEPGERIHLKGMTTKKEVSPADTLKKLRFGLFGPGYDFWEWRARPELADKGMTVEKLGWKKYKRPDYPLQDIAISPSCMTGVPEKVNRIMTEYVGANLLQPNAKPEHLAFLGKRFKGFCFGKQGIALDRKGFRLDKHKNIKKTRELLAAHPDAKIYWYIEIWGDMSNASKAALDYTRREVEKAKAATGRPENIVVVLQPWPPSLAATFAYDKGADVMSLKNEELPQHNIIISMARGAGRSYGKPWSWGCATIKTPFPSMDFREQYFLLFYFSGSSFLNSESEDIYTYPRIMEYTVPYLKALRFQAIHPAIGQPVERIGVLWSKGDPWAAPFTIFGLMDTFFRYVEYDHKTRSLICKHALELELKPGMWDKPGWLRTSLDYRRAHLEDQRGYNLLDVFLPKYGDFLTARFARMLTGTPYGPLDFLYDKKVPLEVLKEYDLLTCLGPFRMTPGVEKKLEGAVADGARLVLAVSHLKDRNGKLGQPFGLKLTDERKKAKGAVIGAKAVYREPIDPLDVDVYGITDAEPVLTSVDGDVPVIVKKAIGKGEIYVVLTDRMAECAKGVRPLLAYLGGQVNMTAFEPADDQIEYVVNRKGEGALVTVFNHGAIPVGSDRVTRQQIKPPEPLVSQVKGPWKGSVTFHLDRIGLPTGSEYELFAVEGVDGQAFERVLSGKASFALSKVKAKRTANKLQAEVTIGKRAEYVIAPKDQGNHVFFGK